MSAAFRALLQRNLDGSTRIDAQPEKCPYQQRSVAAPHLQILASNASPSQAVFPLHEPSAAAQAECLRRISFDRSRQKRGPPSFLA